jgi:prefoldin subunit 5
MLSATREPSAPDLTREQELEMLREQAERLDRAQDDLRKRIQDLEASDSGEAG